VSTSGLEATFTDTSANAPTSWTWDFGDGTKAGSDDPTPNPVHAYAEPGTYTVKLTARNDGGGDTATQTVTVTQPPADGGPPVTQPPPGDAPPADQPAGGTAPEQSSHRLGGGLALTTPPARLTVARARGALRRALRSRLHGWKVTRLACRPAGAGRVRCSLRARRGERRVSGTALLSVHAGRDAVRYRLTVRRPWARHRVVHRSGTVRPR
jgi:hypothetical protein